MYQNILPYRSGRNTVHAARGIAVVAGLQVRFISFYAEQNGFSAADSFEVVLPFFVRDTQGGETVLANGPDFQSILLGQDTIPVQLYVGYPRNPDYFGVGNLTQIMDGYMDTARWDFDDTGEIVTLTGRNAVGQMIDTKVTNKLPNMTSSAIAAKFAAEHGLTPVITPTTTLAGTYYNQNSAVMGNETTEWDLLLFLARQENFIVRVKGKQLLFGPYATVTGYVNQAPIPYTWGYDIERLEIERSPHAAKDLMVKVITYDRNGKHRIIETAKSTSQYAKRIGGQTGERQQYIETYTIPGLTREQAQKKAASILGELSRSQLIGQITAAGNTDMGIDRKIVLYGVGQGLSDNYYLNRVKHSFDLSSGYAIDCSFSNQFLVADSQGVT